MFPKLTKVSNEENPFSTNIMKRIIRVINPQLKEKEKHNICFYWTKFTHPKSLVFELLRKVSFSIV